MAAVDQLLDRIDDLPAMPSSAARLLSALMAGEGSMDEVEKIVRQDEGISMSVLRYANSAQYGRPGRVFSLQESCTRLGTKMLMRIAVEQQARCVVRGGGRAYGIERDALWRGALAGGLAAEHIARAADHPQPELCFTCGLLRDVGKLAIDHFATPEELASAALEADVDGSFLDAEREAFGADHAELGAAIARRWKLPEAICDAIRFHHDPPPPEDERHDPLFDVVHAADVVVLWSGVATGHDGLHYPLAPHVRRSLLKTRRCAEGHIAHMWTRFHEIEEESATTAA